MASGADEGRGKLRKAAGKSKHLVIRRFPNGAIRMSMLMHCTVNKIAVWGEPPELKHLSRARKRNQPRFCE